MRRECSCFPALSAVNPLWLLSPMDMVGMDSNQTLPAPPPRRSAPRRAHGFTLIELLVTVAIIGILSSLFVPSLARAKARGQQISCLNNIRQLHVGWTVYAHDHSDRLAYNLGATEISKHVQANLGYNWANSVLDWEENPANTNGTLNTQASLGAYVGRCANLFRCPNDRALSSLQQRANYGPRSRSHSMNAMVGDPGEFLQSGSNVNNPYHRQYMAMGEFSATSNIFIFVEEHPDSINDGYFLNKAYSGEWTDLPASYHDGAANFSFADGHQETHRWTRDSTKPPARPDAADLPMPLVKADRADFNWVTARMSVR